MTLYQMKRLAALIAVVLVIGGGGLGTVGYLTYKLITKPDSTVKYTIYAADKTYHANEFTVTGNTIYFRDCVNNKNVCINGQYTLIYERGDD